MLPRSFNEAMEAAENSGFVRSILPERVITTYSHR